LRARLPKVAEEVYKEAVSMGGGYQAGSTPWLLEAVHRLTYLTLGAAIGLWAIILPLRLHSSAPASYGRVPLLLYSLTQTYAIWLPSLALLGLAMRYLTQTPSWQRYLTAAAFPVYLLHLPLLMITAYYLQRLPLPWYVQWSLALFITVATAFALYEYVIRRIRITRLLFGLESPRASS
jgi:membrane-bound acyltransferase YfiQ involved in biofilm formation